MRSPPFRPGAVAAPGLGLLPKGNCVAASKWLDRGCCDRQSGPTRHPNLIPSRYRHHTHPRFSTLSRSRRPRYSMLNRNKAPVTRIPVGKCFAPSRSWATIARAVPHAELRDISHKRDRDPPRVVAFANEERRRAASAAPSSDDKTEELQGKFPGHRREGVIFSNGAGASRLDERCPENRQRRRRGVGAVRLDGALFPSRRT